MHILVNRLLKWGFLMSYKRMLVEDLTSLFKNIVTFGDYLEPLFNCYYLWHKTHGNNIDFSLKKYKRTTCFLATTEQNGKYRFFPCSFIAYKNNTRTKHNMNKKINGNLAWHCILKVTKEKPIDLNDEFIQYCTGLGLKLQLKHKRKFVLISSSYAKIVVINRCQFSR